MLFFLEKKSMQKKIALRQIAGGTRLRLNARDIAQGCVARQDTIFIQRFSHIAKIDRQFPAIQYQEPRAVQ